MFRALIFSAAAAGLFAGLLTAGYQLAVVTPLILEAEIYEAGLHHHDHAHDGHDHAHGTEEAAHAHTHDHEDGLLRHLLTIVATTIVSTGWALVLLGLVVLDGGRIDWRRGLGWGAAAFVAVALAPAVSLPPELPGMPNSPTGARQLWWALAVAATGFGLWAILRRRTLPFIVLGTAAILAPHLIGAPHAPGPSDVPPDLAARFVAVSLAGSLIMWLALAGSATALFSQWSSEAGGDG
jgi:cobalt transporter subunit CbtA